LSSGPASKARGVSAGPEVKTERNFGTGPGRPRIKEVLTVRWASPDPEMTGSSCYPNGLDLGAKPQATSSKLQATSGKLDRTVDLGYYRSKQKGIK